MRVILLGYTVATDAVRTRLRPWLYNEDHVTDADLLAEYAGRICYRSWDHPRPETAANRPYLRRTIVEQRHVSIARHSSVTFLLEGVSRHLLGELTRHHFPAFSVESLRYCPPRTYAVHPALAEHGHEGQLRELWQTCLGFYESVYEDLIAKGLPRKKAREAAAQFLPLATATDLVVSANLNAWRDVLSQRLPGNANAEIRKLAGLLRKELLTIAPNVFQDFEEDA